MMSEKWHKLTTEDCKKLFNGWLEEMADGKGEIYNRVERLVGEDISPPLITASPSLTAGL